jgi:hypothetical protein
MDPVLLLDFDGFHESSILSPAMAVSITVYINFPSFYDIDAFLASRLQQSLIGEIKCFLELACDACLHFLGPSAKEEYAGLDYR